MEAKAEQPQRAANDPDHSSDPAPNRCRRGEHGRGVRSMQRIMVMGPPGSGKSTLAHRLGTELGLPVFHLDQLYHRPGWVPAPTEDFRADVERITQGSAWVLDGNYTSTIGPRLWAADTLIYPDIPTWLTMARIIRRILSSYGKVRADAAPGCPERLNMEFLRFAWNWNSRTRNLALVQSFGGRLVVLSCHDQNRAFRR